MAQGNQIGGLLAGHDAREFRDLDGIALGVFALDDPFECGRGHDDASLRHGDSARDVLGADVDHAGTTFLVEVREPVIAIRHRSPPARAGVPRGAARMSRMSPLTTSWGFTFPRASSRARRKRGREVHRGERMPAHVLTHALQRVFVDDDVLGPGGDGREIAQPLLDEGEEVDELSCPGRRKRHGHRVPGRPRTARRRRHHGVRLPAELFERALLVARRKKGERAAR